MRRRVTSRTWPGALLIRIPFDRQAIRLNRALEKHIPKGVTALLNEQQYDPVPRDAYLDVFYFSGIDGIAKAMPTIVWVHGGAWISGRKDYIRSYLKILAARGYSVVAVGYSNSRLSVGLPGNRAGSCSPDAHSLRQASDTPEPGARETRRELTRLGVVFC